MHIYVYHVKKGLSGGLSRWWYKFSSILLCCDLFDLNNYFILNFNYKFGPFFESFGPSPTHVQCWNFHKKHTIHEHGQHWMGWGLTLIFGFVLFCCCCCCCFVLFCFALFFFCFVLFCFVLFFVLFCFVLFFFQGKNGGTSSNYMATLTSRPSGLLKCLL